MEQCIYKLVLGDRSKYGHGIIKSFYFYCNCDIHKIRQAYKDSCKKLGITFDNAFDYTGLDLPDKSDKCIWTEYGEPEINKTAFDILNEAGCFTDIPYILVGFDEACIIEKDEDCAKLIMNFIAVSMPNDFSYKLLDDCESINGNCDFGYALYD